ncbi:hypothetical protein HPB49_010129 [Dermacentor silvarum]|uniref:Uncharacterized protein n=1 Tax=Dermacentor silvarum TaxID=543639 RepID=A0ACB8DCJ3_DERSI|nr:hypothetical protein HPB49_010129 [Dermacentor silvarum]
MDSHLLHLWKAKVGLEQRWQRQRWNTTLRRRLNQLKKEIETHAAALAKIRNSTHQTQIMTKLKHASQASPQELLQTLRELHFPAYPPGDQPDYTWSCTKVALSLSPSTSTARLLNLGTQNSFDELAEATLTAQFTRLSGTAIGRTLLCQLGIAPITHSTENMHPEHDGKRRAARADALYKQYGDSYEVAYVDVATLIITDSCETAEKAAIALALISISSTKILFDSKSTLSNFDKGLLSGTTARLLRFWHPTCPVTLIWTPTHAGFPGKEVVHSLARGLTFRAGVGPPLPALERLLTFRDILTHYRDTRPLYAQPAVSLILTQASHWRRLQTRTPPYPILLHARYPDQFLSSCKLCGKPGDFLHVLLTCPTFPHAPSQTTVESYWETLLASSTATDQRLIIAAAMKRIALQGLSIGL